MEYRTLKGSSYRITNVYGISYTDAAYQQMFRKSDGFRLARYKKSIIGCGYSSVHYKKTHPCIDSSTHLGSDVLGFRLTQRITPGGGINYDSPYLAYSYRYACHTNNLFSDVGIRLSKKISKGGAIVTINNGCSPDYVGYARPKQVYAIDSFRLSSKATHGGVYNLDKVYSRISSRVAGCSENGRVYTGSGFRLEYRRLRGGRYINASDDDYANDAYNISTSLGFRLVFRTACGSKGYCTTDHSPQYPKPFLGYRLMHKTVIGDLCFYSRQQAFRGTVTCSVRLVNADKEESWTTHLPYLDCISTNNRSTNNMRFRLSKLGSSVIGGSTATHNPILGSAPMPVSPSFKDVYAVFRKKVGLRLILHFINGGSWCNKENNEEFWSIMRRGSRPPYDRNNFIGFRLASRLLRGGSWSTGKTGCTVRSRSVRYPYSLGRLLGFRLIRKIMKGGSAPYDPRYCSISDRAAGDSFRTTSRGFRLTTRMNCGGSWGSGTKGCVTSNRTSKYLYSLSKLSGFRLTHRTAVGGGFSATKYGCRSAYQQLNFPFYYIQEGCRLVDSAPYASQHTRLGMMYREVAGYNKISALGYGYPDEGKSHGGFRLKYRHFNGGSFVGTDIRCLLDEKVYTDPYLKYDKKGFRLIRHVKDASAYKERLSRSNPLLNVLYCLYTGGSSDEEKRFSRLDYVGRIQADNKHCSGGFRLTSKV